MNGYLGINNFWGGAENIAYNYASSSDNAGKTLSDETYLEIAEKFMNQWINSPGHRENMLSDQTLLGCGVSIRYNQNSGSVRVYGVQNFMTARD